MAYGRNNDTLCQRVPNCRNSPLTFQDPEWSYLAEFGLAKLSDRGFGNTFPENSIWNMLKVSKSWPILTLSRPQLICRRDLRYSRTMTNLFKDNTNSKKVLGTFLEKSLQSRLFNLSTRLETRYFRPWAKPQMRWRWGKCCGPRQLLSFTYGIFWISTEFPRTAILSDWHVRAHRDPN